MAARRTRPRPPRAGAGRPPRRPSALGRLSRITATRTDLVGHVGQTPRNPLATDRVDRRRGVTRTTGELLRRVYSSPGGRPSPAGPVRLFLRRVVPPPPP